MYSNLIIDSNNLYWRAVCTSMQDVSEIEGAEIYSAVLINFIDRIGQLKRKFLNPGGKVFLLFDNPKSTINLRQIIDENYKHARANKDVPKAFWDTLVLLQEILRVYDNDFIVVKAEAFEADDLVVPVLKKCPSMSLLISADLDWSRSLTETVHWFNFKTLYTLDIFKDKYGFYPDGNRIKIYKSIRGDKSDCIEIGVPHIPEKIVLHLLENYEDIEDVIQNVFRDDLVSSLWKGRIKENRQRLITNYQLVDFIDVPEKDIQYIECKYSLKALTTWYRLLDMPFEQRMLISKNKEAKPSDFFSKKKITRVSQF